MPYLTPDDAPASFAQFVIWLPVDAGGVPLVEFEAILAGALLTLTWSYNFEEFGSLTPAQTAAVFGSLYDLSIPWSAVP